MQLIYLYVENYKNIQNQGFNFTTQFKCEYKDGTLTIDKNENYIENFFGDNIAVSAIVGENGSGKSNLLELVSDIGYFENPYAKKEYPSSFLDLNKITIYYDKEKNVFYFNEINFTSKIENKTSIQIEKITAKDKSVQNVFIKPIPTYAQQEYLLLLDFFKNNRMKFPFDIPKIISFGIHDDFYELLELIKNENFNFHDIYTPFEENQERRLKIFHILILLAYLKNYNIHFNVQASENFDDTISSLEDKIDKDIKSKIRNFIQLPLEDFSVITQNYINLEKVSSDFFKIYIEIIKRKNKDDLLDFKGKNVFNFDLYPKMSDGQYQLTYIFNAISTQIKQDFIILCIDEGENFLHPNWQKKYMYYLNQFLKENFFDKQIQLILSSHSPFILSDIPRQNIVFLKGGKQVDALEKKQTFGANIHTLLADGFFMDGGLMGEFAKEKIEEVIKFLNGDISKIQDKNEAQKIINIIGEPVLKNQLQKMLDSRNLSEVDKIKQEIGKLQNRLEKLKNGKD